jgi:uncharacterized membrane protein YtjA (UPF0391 family)
VGFLIDHWHFFCVSNPTGTSGRALALRARARPDFVVYRDNLERGGSMALLKWAFLFLILAGIAGLLGFSGIAAGAEDISKVLFIVFLVIFAVIGILAMTAFKTVT